MERDDAKKLARHEIEAEKRELEEKIASLYQEITRTNANRDISIAQLYSRFYIDAYTNNNASTFLYIYHYFIF